MPLLFGAYHFNISRHGRTRRPPSYVNVEEIETSVGPRGIIDIYYAHECTVYRYHSELVIIVHARGRKFNHTARLFQMFG